MNGVQRGSNRNAIDEFAILLLDLQQLPNTGTLGSHYRSKMNCVYDIALCYSSPGRHTDESQFDTFVSPS